MRGKLVVGNWKMNGGLRQNDALLAELRARWAAPVGRDLALCVPYPYLWQAQAALSGSAISWGAQNVSEHAGGAYTGEVSAAMVAEFGCRFALVGHSERRARCGETDVAVADKAAAALGAGLTPIVCVGESLAQRESHLTHSILKRQFEGGLDALTEHEFSRILLAYEPVWAIGTGKTATPEMAADAHRYLRELAATVFSPSQAAGIRILYGGSVKPDNIKGLMAQAEIDGALVGGASLDARSFAAIVNF